MRRLRAGGDTRLHDRYSIGVGGHVGRGGRRARRRPGPGVVGGAGRRLVARLRARGPAQRRHRSGRRGAPGRRLSRRGRRPPGRHPRDAQARGLASPRSDEVDALGERLETWSRLCLDHLMAGVADERHETGSRGPAASLRSRARVAGLLLLVMSPPRAGRRPGHGRRAADDRHRRPGDGRPTCTTASLPRRQRARRPWSSSWTRPVARSTATHDIVQTLLGGAAAGHRVGGASRVPARRARARSSPSPATSPRWRPGTNIGAASPVGSQGQDIGGTLGDKVMNDAVASITAIADARGRPVRLGRDHGP